jgi:epsin
LNNAYSQPTGYQNGGYGGGFGYNQPQQTGFEQLQQPAQQFIQPQNTYNPWAQQMNGFGSQPPQQAASPEPQQPVAQPGSNNPWATPSSQSSIQATPTGSNNPFASRPPPSSHSFSKAPTLSTLQEQAAANNFNQRTNPIQSFQAPVSTPSPALQPQTRPSPPPQSQSADPYKANLNAILASGEGQDTFGNVGDLRIPAQHTAPGTFVNSAGGGSMGRLESSRTGTNPFFTQNTATQVQFPAQTGPAGGLAGPGGGLSFAGNSNPFGSRPPGQPQQQQGQGGSLIDL